MKIIKLEPHITSSGTLYDLNPGQFGFDTFKHAYTADIQCGKTRGGHYHKHKTEVIVCLSGLVGFNIAGSAGQIRIGECVLIEPNETHILSAIDKPAVITVLCDSKFDPDDVYKEEDAK